MAAITALTEDFTGGAHGAEITTANSAIELVHRHRLVGPPPLYAEPVVLGLVLLTDHCCSRDGHRRPAPLESTADLRDG
jgi:hypothetical protein